MTGSAADSALLLVLCAALFKQFIDGRQPCGSFVVLKSSTGVEMIDHGLAHGPG